MFIISPTVILWVRKATFLLTAIHVRRNRSLIVLQKPTQKKYPRMITIRGHLKNNLLLITWVLRKVYVSISCRLWQWQQF